MRIRPLKSRALPSLPRTQLSWSFLRASLSSCGLLLLLGCSDPAPTETVQPPVAKPPADTVRTVEVTAGVRHTYRWEVSGPQAIHVLEMDLARCGLALRTVKALDRLIGRETTTQLSARLAARTGRTVYAAINGDYFSFTPAGYPVGAQVIEGEPLRGFTSRPVFGVTANATTFFGADQLTGTLRSRRAVTFDMRRVNEAPDTLRIALFNSYAGSATSDENGLVEVVARVTRNAAAIGDTARAVVERIDTTIAGVAIPAGSVVLSGRGRGAQYLRTNVAIGDTISWTLRFTGAPAGITEMIAGDPHLLRAGNSLAPFAGTVAAERHPRTAIGQTADRRILLVTVDGRQPGYSAGMTLVELTDLMARLGARDAINLDGGGSTTMVVNGRVVNRPSDATGERPVANAVGVAAVPCAS